MYEWIIEQQLIAKHELVNRMAMETLYKTIHLHDLGPGAEENAIRMVLHIGHLQRDSTLIGKIVLVLPGDVLASGQGNPTIQRGCKALIGLVQYAYSLIMKGRYDVSGLVGRAIIDNDELEACKCLANYAFNGTPKISFAVINGKHYRYDWACQVSASESIRIMSFVTIDSKI